MGTLTVDELISEIQEHFANRDDLTTAKAVRALNLAQEQIATLHDYRELRQLVSTTLTYTGVKSTDRFVTFSSLGISGTIRAIYSFRIITGTGESRKLTAWSPRIMDEHVPETEFWPADKPSNYVIWANTFELYPIPDQAYDVEIRLTTWPSALVAGSGKSDFEKKDQALIKMAVSYIWDTFGEYDRASRFYNNATTLLRVSQDYDEYDRPDRDIKPPSGAANSPTGTSYWADPFTRGVR